ncbi:hypothetical protein ACJMK2_005725 [Sinanodonta woodiana]|uniref:Ras-related protein Rab-24 n=1 Tax=Sinanodonta woodiana TaxID=1069815 RepID=A0ABD3VU01_SINWO
MSSVNLKCKVVLLGADSVGKTCLVLRYIRGRFPSMVDATIGAYMTDKKEQIDKKEVTLQIWDTAGHEKYDSLTQIYYRKANAIIICYDVTRRESIDKACSWLQKVIKTEQDCKIYLCETRIGLVYQRCADADFTTIMALAEEYKVPIYKTSSKTGENIDVLFKKVVEDYVAAINSMNPLDLDDSMKLFRDRTKIIHRGCYLM